MTDDIVTRLRGYDWMRDSDTVDATIREAADEIERLREQNEHLRANVEMLLAEARSVRGE